MPGEFDLIDLYFRRRSARGDVILGIGDDAAVLTVPAARQLAVTVDTLVAGVHFPAATDPAAIGHKALAVNLSDLAAMGAEPAWVALSLTLPQPEPRWLEAFAEGFFALAEQYGVSLVGGDTTRGPLSITVQASGFVPPGMDVRRSGAHVGDAIYVTGTLGDAGLGLAWQQGRRTLEASDGAAMRARLDCPTPRVEAGLVLRGRASAAIDVSDGLAGDLRHVLRASGVGAVLDVDALPVSAVVAGQADARELALSAGDDYELLFTVAPDRAGAILAGMDELALRCTCIGRIVSEPGLQLTDAAGQPFVTPVTAGYDHFREND
ncbi:thiamine-phosphate kinase [Acidihalobacter ferrooxydans]|uniref:thiamine-phosphate kinase n=1 Tax=Acidihalobacter ferrooxydans TaxID=1765967 RepID=UPI001E622BF6|nr:thiamine-phosphate kinase [Acidihalobacter ferrooxydans]